MIIFLHIPKTSGLTLRSCLSRQYAADEVFVSGWGGKVSFRGLPPVGVFSDQFNSFGLFAGLRRPDEVWFPASLPLVAARFEQLPDTEQTRVRLVYGEHIEFGLHEYLAQPAAYFTLLREPVERVLSHYYFARTIHSVPDTMSLSEHIAAHVEPNLQTRLLAGPRDRTESMAPEEMLEHARHNLRSCVVVGLTERFDETVILLRKAFGWRMPFYERSNTGKRRLPRTRHSPEVLRRIEADNSLDMALYAYARELFEEHARHYGPTLARDTVLFRRMNFLWQRMQAGKKVLEKYAGETDRRIIDPSYRVLARWGGLRRILPSRFAPRVVASVENNLLYFHLKVGGRVVGHYDPQTHCWDIRRPFHLLVDERTLPCATQSP